MSKDINAKIKAVGKTTKVDVIDLDAESRKITGFTSDGVHPNAAGARKIAEKIHEVLTADE